MNKVLTALKNLVDEVLPEDERPALERQEQETRTVLSARIRRIDAQLRDDLGREPTHGEIWEAIYR